MPELPEVTTIANDLDKELRGEAFKAISASVSRMVSPNVAFVAESLGGKRVKRVKRVGKMILFDFGGLFLLIHLKLSGRLLLTKVENSLLRWERVRIDFTGGKSICFEDLRMFGYVKLLDQDSYEATLSKLGKDALDISPQDFYNAIKGSNQAIKKVLLDQSRLSGIGNIYANEALFKAKINPERKAKSLSPEESRRLIRAAKEVLEVGIASRGATISDELYRDIYGQRGGYGKHALVYGKAGKSCPNGCRGVIKKISVGGRGTYFCPKCQKI